VCLKQVLKDTVTSTDGEVRRILGGRNVQKQRNGDFCLRGSKQVGKYELKGHK
jgi:hypothetical protein